MRRVADYLSTSRDVMVRFTPLNETLSGTRKTRAITKRESELSATRTDHEGRTANCRLDGMRGGLWNIIGSRSDDCGRVARALDRGCGAPA
jgi:hypothetical protein